MRVDVEVRGAGLAGRLVAQQLLAAGATVRLVDPYPEAAALPTALPLRLPTHPEHPHRLLAALGLDRARNLVDFINASSLSSVQTGIYWRPFRGEAREFPASIAAARQLGLTIREEGEGFWLEQGTVVEVPGLPMEVVAKSGAAEMEVLCGGWAALDPFLEEKLTPVRHVALRFAGGQAVVPTVSWHTTLRFLGTPAGLWACGAREATPHLEVGETRMIPDARVVSALEGISRGFYADLGPVQEVRCGIVGDSCDGLPIVGPIPGRPRTLVCTGFGMAGFSYASACATALVDGILTGRPGNLPTELSTERFR